MSATKKSKLRHLRLLFYLIPVLAIILAYGGIIVATGESYPFTIVIGPSMQPTILPGSVAVIANTPFQQLKIGDVIVFKPQLALIFHCDGGPTNSLISETQVPCFVIHRIVNISVKDGQQIVTTKGDDNSGSIPGIDTNINSSMYIGRVVLQMPDAGYVTTYPTNEILAIIILAALAAEMIYDRSQNRKRAAAERVVNEPQSSTVGKESTTG